MPRYAARVDDNQSEIVEALRAAGALVQPLHTVGGGVPDLLVAYRGTWYMIEIKDGSKPPSRRKLTDDERRWHDTFNEAAPVYVCGSIDEALEVIGAI